MSKRKEKPAESTEKKEFPKNFAIVVLAIILLSVIGAYLTYQAINSPSDIDYGDDEEERPDGPYAPGTHMVMAELFVTPHCPACSNAEDDLVGMEENRSDFYFVSMVYDGMDPSIKDVSQRFNEIGDSNGSVPDTVFDGGKRDVLGDLGPDAYAEGIDICKDVPVPSVKISADVSLYGDRVVKGNIEIDTKGDFKGHVRVFVVELESTRYVNENGNPIPNAFLGYAANNSLDFTSSHSEEVQWEGDGLHPGNVGVIVAVYDKDGYAVQAYRVDL